MCVVPWVYQLHWLPWRNLTDVLYTVRPPMQSGNRRRRQLKPEGRVSRTYTVVTVCGDSSFDIGAGFHFTATVRSLTASNVHSAITVVRIHAPSTPLHGRQAPVVSPLKSWLAIAQRKRNSAASITTQCAINVFKLQPSRRHWCKEINDAVCGASDVLCTPLTGVVNIASPGN